MSYCRWADDYDGKHCNIYCYASTAGGYTIHVANSGPIGPDPEFPDQKDPTSIERYLKACEENMKPIGLPHDGETFNEDSLEKFRDRLLYLIAAGYHVP